MQFSTNGLILNAAEITLLFGGVSYSRTTPSLFYFSSFIDGGNSSSIQSSLSSYDGGNS